MEWNDKSNPKWKFDSGRKWNGNGNGNGITQEPYAQKTDQIHAWKGDGKRRGCARRECEGTAEQRGRNGMQ